MKFYLQAAASGLLLWLSLPPNDLWFVAWFALVPVWMGAEGEGGWRRFWAGLLVGTLVNLGAFWFCLELMLEYSQLSVFAYLVMGILSAFQGLPYALWLGLTPRGRWEWVAGSTLLVAFEYLHPLIFPWYLANSQHSMTVTTQSLDLLGPSGLSFVLVTFNLALAGALRGRFRAVFWLGLLLACFNLVYGLYHLGLQEPAGRTLRLAVVQPNTWIQGPSPARTLFRYQVMMKELLERQAVDLIVLPESAISTPPYRYRRRGQREFSSAHLDYYPLDLEALAPSRLPLAETFSQDLSQNDRGRLALQRGHSVPLLFGASGIDLRPGVSHPIEGRLPLYNLAILVDSQGDVAGLALKNKLLIFGEYFPFSRYFPDVYRLLPHASALLAGTEPSVLPLDQARIGVMICYEDLLSWFGLELMKAQPNLLINLSNDAWFGKTAEPAAHLALAKARAIEHRCFLVRATTTGISAVIDPLGRVKGQLGVDRQEVLVADVGLRFGGTLYQKVGNLFPWLCLVVGLVVLWLGPPCDETHCRPEACQPMIGEEDDSHYESHAQSCQD